MRIMLLADVASAMKPARQNLHKPGDFYLKLLEIFAQPAG